MDRRRLLRHPVYLGLRDDKKRRRRSCARTDAGRLAAATNGRLRPRAAAPETGSSATGSIEAIVDQLASSSRTHRRDGTLDAARRRHARSHQSAQGVLAEAEAHEGRSASLLRAGRAVHPAGRRRPAAGDEALPERRRRKPRSISIGADRVRRGRARRAAAGGRRRGRSSSAAI